MLQFYQWYEANAFDSMSTASDFTATLDWIERGGKWYHSLLPIPFQLVETAKDFNDTRTSADIGAATRSSQSRILVKKWLQDCVESHQCCRLEQRSRSFFPTRILDVGKMGDRSIKLRTHLSEKTQPKLYATLSYYRGTSNHIRLSSKSIDQFLSGIDIQHLPRTFQNAIAITREVGLQYLWIDSLCIIQDSKSDWLSQSALRGEIYNQSHLTIAATASESSDGGLFFDRSASSILPLQVSARFPFGDLTKQRKTYNIVDPIQASHMSTFTTAPLHARGWALQERVLANRTLHCTEDMLYWECHCLFANESYPEGLGVQHEGIALFRESSKSYPPRDISRSSFYTKTLTWLKLIKAFTARNLSNDEDILIAISGLAKKWQKNFPERYVAGLWHTYLGIGLLWHGETKDSTNRGGTSSRTWRAPSWSWASYKGAVTWSDRVLVPSHAQPLSVIKAELFRPSAIDVQSLTGDETGQLRSGSISGYGFLTEVVLKPKWTDDTDDLPVTHDARRMSLTYGASARPAVLYTSTTKFEGYAYFDSQRYLDALKETRYFIGLPIIVVQTTHKDPKMPPSSGTKSTFIEFEGILLRRKDVDPKCKVLERIGYFSVRSQLESKEQISAICTGLGSCKLGEIADRLGFAAAQRFTLV